MPNDIDDQLFKGMPKSVQALNKQSRKENRLKRRLVWAQQNPNNPRVAGKKIGRP